MSERPAIRDAAHTLWESFFQNCPGVHPYVNSIGVGSDSIKVLLVRNVIGHERQIPKEWEGWPVETAISGRFYLR